MLFKMCSISGKAYRSDRRTSDEAEDKTPFQIKPPSDIAEDSTIQVVELDLRTISPIDPEQPHGRQLPFTAPDDTDKFSDSKLLSDIQNATDINNPNVSGLNHFFAVLSLCHTVLAEIDPKTRDIEYKAQSPDEAALVQAASDLGFVFLGKDRGILSIRTPRSGEVEKYELLEILEFTSARKRMSVLLRSIDMGSDTDELLLLTKGADDVIFERLLKNAAQEEMKRKTEVHLTEFARSGLRTLTLAYRTVTGMFRSNNPFNGTAPVLRYIVSI
jgi:phospholipid-translocating ATPase